jgi:sugar/nucleoside kinase (ribokinase family)
LDTNWDPDGTWDLADVLAETDVFLPNRAELLGVTGCASVPEALDAMAAHGCDVVVKLGEVGAVSRTGRGTVRVAAMSPATFADAVGAGDTFDAGLVVGRLSGLDDEQSLRLAVAAGTLSTRGVGGTATQPDLAEAQAWADRLMVTSGAAEEDR